MENLTLTKENFWNLLHTEYPDEMEVFCKWIDDYKKRVNWTQLFNFGSPHYMNMGWHDPKFHDLPIAFQIGIFTQFTFEAQSVCTLMDCVTKDTKDMKQFREAIHQFFQRENICGKLRDHVLS